MDILRLFNNKIAIFVLVFPFLLNSQEKEEKFFYKDTMFDFNGSKVEITKSLATKSYFKSVVCITNQSDNFLLINPWDVFGFVSGSSERYNATSKRVIVIAPKYTKKFVVKFEGSDFREPHLSFDVAKLQITEEVTNIMEFSDIDLNKENFRAVGPVKLTIQDKRIDKDRALYRMETEISYSGDKFLGIFYNNIRLKTKDGSVFINSSKKRDDFHYDVNKPFKRIVLIFPVEAEKIKKESEPKLNFSDVFKEYSLSTIVGFKVNLRSGTLEDYKGKKTEDKDIEEIE